jgi:hypothetical protein
MRADNTYPSFWSGIAASEYYFEDTIDYSSWACLLLEEGHDSINICILAGLFDENNRFELRQWHRRVLQDLGYSELSARERFLAHLRGYAEEFIDGKRDFKDITQHFHEVYMDTKDELLAVFNTLHYGYWDFDEVDMSDMGISTLEDFPRACTDASRNLLKTIQAEVVAADRQKLHSYNPTTPPDPAAVL